MVRAGYKQTEVGLIPEDWDLLTIKDVCAIINGRGFKPYEWSQNGLPIIRIQNLNGSDDFNHYSGVFDPKIFIKHSQLLFAWSGSRGTSFGPHIWNGGNALLNYHTWKLSIDDSKVDSEYFYHALKILTKQIEDQAHGASALVHTQKCEMEKFVFVLPQKEEQRAIAKALSDVDALIASLDKLIAKKRGIKTAAMQQLLTGKTRLPGFGEGKGYKKSEIGRIPEDWVVMELKNLLILPPQYGINAAATKYQSDLPVYIRITDISDDGYFSPEKIVSVNNKNADQYYLKKGDIVFARTGASVGKSYLYNSLDGDLVYAGFLIKIRPDETVLLPTFLIQYVRTKQYWDWVQLMSMRSGQPGINGTEFGRLLLPLPLIAEQSVIASILSDMDAEIDALQNRRNKTKSIKQGMMQELLTGRTRLI